MMMMVMMMKMPKNVIIKTTSTTTMRMAWIDTFCGALFVHTVKDYHLLEDTLVL